jgi:hypothetical protein
MVVVSIRCANVTVQIPGEAVFATIPQGFRPKKLERAVIAVIRPVSSTFPSESAIQIDTAGRVIQWLTDIPVGAEFDILFVYELA